MAQLRGEHAVVLGGGMAGLMTSRVLADRYRKVTVVDRDTLIGVTEARTGAPQARHAHALLARGQRTLEKLFPGMQAELTAAGVLTGDVSGDLRWYLNGLPLQQAESGALSVSAARPTLEAHVRARVAALPNVEFLERTVIQGLVASADRGRITGVRVAGEDDEPRRLDADLVVDASGRGSRTPVWLAELGYERPAEERVKIDLAYTSRYFRLNSDPFGRDLAINPLSNPVNPRGAFFGKFPGDIALLSLTGMLGDHPPRDHEGFLAFARSLAPADIYEAVRDAEPLSEIATFRFPASIRKRYDRLRRFPDALLVIGDSHCIFNPVYGQGMTVASMEADALGRHLDEGAVRPLAFFREIKPIIDVPWETSATADLAYPDAEGNRTLKTKLGNAYVSRLLGAALLDGRFTATFFRVAGLIDPPQTLMKPGLVRDVLRTWKQLKKMPAPAQQVPEEMPIRQP